MIGGDPGPSSSSPSRLPLAPGFRFHPTDEELINYYLKRKSLGLPLNSTGAAAAIADINIYKHSPWELPSLSPLSRRGDTQWFFFSTLVNRKLPSLQVDRATPGGFWKSTGNDRPVHCHDGRAVIGMRKTLVFHLGRSRHRQRTNWVMHEYRQIEDEEDRCCITGPKKSFVVCKVYEKSGFGPRKEFQAQSVKQWEDADVTEEDNAHLYAAEQASSSQSVSTNKRLAPGFRFHPSDQELVSYYLKRKTSGLSLFVDAIIDVDFYKWDPWKLPALSPLGHSRDKEWYFFALLDRKYAARTRIDRATPNGYWKSTGIDRPIRHCDGRSIVGMRKTLVYHFGRTSSGRRTDWVMHEYYLLENEHDVSGSFVVCRLYRKDGYGPKRGAHYGGPFIEEEWDDAAENLHPARQGARSASVMDSAHQDAVDQGTLRTIYKIGSPIEVSYISENLPVAWYTATVSNIVNDDIFLVEYERLRNEDDSLLTEVVSSQYIRPRPPAPPVKCFNLLDEVEAFYKGGWWQGVVAKVNSGSRYNVKLMHWEEEIEFSHSELRILYDWVDGQWLPSSQDKSIESQNFGRLESVEHMQVLHERNPADRCETTNSITHSGGFDDGSPSQSPICTSNDGDEVSDESTSQNHIDDLLLCKKAKKRRTIEDNRTSFDSGGIEMSSAGRTGFDVRTPIIEEDSNFRAVEKCFSHSSLDKMNVENVDSVAKASSGNMLKETSEDPIITEKLSRDSVFHMKSPSNKGTEIFNERSVNSDVLQTVEWGEHRAVLCAPEVNQQTKAPNTECPDQIVEELEQHTEVEERSKSTIPTKRISEPSLEGDSMASKQDNEAFGETPNEGLSQDQHGTCDDNAVEAGLCNTAAFSSDDRLVETSELAEREARSEVLLSTGEELAERALIGEVMDASETLLKFSRDLIGHKRDREVREELQTIGLSTVQSDRCSDSEMEAQRSLKVVVYSSEASLVEISAFGIHPGSSKSKAEVLFPTAGKELGKGPSIEQQVANALSAGGSAANGRGKEGVKGIAVEGPLTVQFSTLIDSESEEPQLFNTVNSSSDASLVQTSAFGSRPDESTPQLPFEKCSPLWQSFESMEVFAVMPQRPHFRPLNQCCKEFREGMAIGLMVTFSKLVNGIGKLQIDDSRHRFDEMLNTLAQLEKHGFNVQQMQAHIAELRRVKDKQIRLVDKKSAVEAALEKKKKESDQLNFEIESTELDVKRVEQSLSQFYKEKFNLLEQSRENDSTVGNLEADSRVVEDALRSAQRDFEAALAAP